MKKYSRFATLAVVATLTYTANLTEVTSRFPVLTGLELVSEAHAVLGVRRRTRRRSVAVGYSMGAANAQQQAAAAPAPAPAPEPAPAPVPAPAAVPPPAAPQPAGAPPLGSMVTTLPDGCQTKAISGVQYNNCSGVFYRTAFQGNNLVYVVSQP